jgi:6-phosphogluconolactonase
MLCFEEYNIDVVMSEIEKVLFKTNSIINIGICAGRSPIEIFQKLSEIKCNWKNIHFYLMDERYVEIDSPDSNYFQLKKYFDFLPASNFHTFYFNGSIDASRAEEVFKSIVLIDLAIVGVGEDGHIFGIFDNYVKHKDYKYVSVNDRAPKPPLKRLTISKEFLVEKVSKCIVLATSKEKHSALASKDELPLDILSGKNMRCYI